MSTAQELLQWESAASFPSTVSTNFAQLNKDEFVCGSFLATIGEKRLLKFNTFQNQWIEFLKLPKELNFNSRMICFNQERSMLHIAAEYPKNYGRTMQGMPEAKVGIISINIKTSEYKEITWLQSMDCSMGQLLLIPNGDIHFIKSEDNAHCILKPEQTKPEILCTYSDYFNDELICHRMIYSSKREMIYIFGGFDDKLLQNNYCIMTCIIDVFKRS